MVTLYLIASNTYASVKGPTNRGFSYIEIWMIGVQISMLMAIIEYGIILAIRKHKKFQKSNDAFETTDTKTDGIMENWNIDEICRKMDLFTFFGSLSFIVLFNIVYWMVYLITT